jgi:hypothetical protein
MALISGKIGATPLIGVRANFPRRITRRTGHRLCAHGAGSMGQLNGRLIKPIDVSFADAQHLLHRPRRAASNAPKVATIRNWLLAEAAERRRPPRLIFWSRLQTFAPYWLQELKND